ncbi:thermonuclease family protein [Hydrogenophaga sp. NFH-34]|uniref:thermonuclease family protein n=1 Tax=Hydrogenophaga sp. NFH-34 TaxID=2744446 RepID=UPI001F1CC13F|nr:thermonuclease family protein [Hydrogenophaga sp. NFH-34]
MNQFAMMFILAMNPVLGVAQHTDVRVVGVSDGDTISVLTANKQSFRVRLSEIDAPETGQDFGQRSKKALSDLCFGKLATVELGSTDQYGRTLSRVSCNGVDAQSHMVANGMAWVYDRYVEDKSLYGLQEQAKRERLGLWSHPSPVPPWHYRAAKRSGAK